MNLGFPAIWYLRVAKVDEDFWRWGDNLEILWVDGSMVATRTELIAILQQLEATGLPHFGSLVQLLAALAGKQISIRWASSEKKDPKYPVVCTIESCGIRHGQHQRVRHFSEPEELSAVVSRLAGLSDELKGLIGDAQSKSALARFLFQDVVPPALSEDVISHLDGDQLRAGDLNHSRWGSKYPSILQDLAKLSQKLLRTSPEALRFYLSS